MSQAASGLRVKYAVFLDGYGYAGNCDEFQPPDLMIEEVDFRAGGMDGVIGVDMGMQKLSCSVMFSKITRETLRLWGAPATVPLIVRGAIRDLDGVVKAEQFRIRGTVPGLAWEALKPGEKGGYTLTLSPREYTYILDGVVVHDIDLLNCKRIINGVDVLAAERAAIGI